MDHQSSLGRPDLPVQQCGIEPGEPLGVGAVERDDGEACDSHVHHRRHDSGRSAPGYAADQARSRTSTERIVGRWRAISDQVSPSSALAKTDPEFVPK